VLPCRPAHGCFVYTNEQWIVEQESKEEPARIKKARTGRITIWDDNVSGGQFGKAAGGKGDIEGETDCESEAESEDGNI
jgi:hypothetical protein